jgi:opacity protein-like surface antigen
MACLLALGASPVRAQGYIGVFTGVNFGGDAGRSLAQALDAGSRLTWGGPVGGMPGGVLGAELDVASARNFFGERSPLGDNSVLTVMPALIVGIPVGGQRGPGIQPYVTAGLGLIRRDLQIGSVEVLKDNDLGYSLGVGVTGYLSDHIGLRGDYRYFRNIDVDESTSALGIMLERGTFHFSRGTIGVLFRF